MINRPTGIILGAVMTVAVGVVVGIVSRDFLTLPVSILMGLGVAAISGLSWHNSTKSLRRTNVQQKRRNKNEKMD